MEEKRLDEKFTTAYEVVEHRLTALWNAIDAIDTKTHIVIGFASVILVVLGGFYSLEPGAWPHLSLILFATALLSYIVLVVLGVLSYRIRGWSYKPDPATLLQHCEDETCSTSDMKRWVVNECKLACYDNLEKLKKKSTLTNWVLRTFAAETILLVSGLAYALVAR